MRTLLSLSLLLSTAALADDTTGAATAPAEAAPAAAAPAEAAPAEAAVTTAGASTAAVAPSTAGWWDPARDAWSKDAVVASFKKVKEGVAPSAFLGDTSGMKKFSRVEWAWFAEGWSPDAYASVAVAPATNGMGRYKVTGEQLIQDLQVQYLQGVTKKWKKKVVGGTEADLVVYTNLRWFSTTANGVEYVVETLGVDKAGNVQFKLQYLAGVNGTAGMVAGALSNGVGGLVSAIPDDRDQFAYYTTTATEVGGLLRTALVDGANAFKKGKELPPSGPAAALHADKSALLPAKQESFGPALTEQVNGWVAFVKDTNNDVKDRADRLRDLGKIGATAAIPVAEEIIRDQKAKNSLQENAAWALGEIGHADAMDTLSTAKGVDGFNVKAAITKITVY